MGNGGWGLFITCCLCRSFLPRGRTPHSSPAPPWGPSHGRQSSMNCSSVGPFPGLQSFRHRLLQRGSPAGSQVLPENLLQRGLPTGSQPPSGIPLLQRGVLSPQAAGGDLVPHGPPWAAGGQPASQWSSPRAAGESLLWRLHYKRLSYNKRLSSHNKKVLDIA